MMMFLELVSLHYRANFATHLVILKFHCRDAILLLKASNMYNIIANNA